MGERRRHVGAGDPARDHRVGRHAEAPDVDLRRVAPGVVHLRRLVRRVPGARDLAVQLDFGRIANDK